MLLKGYSASTGAVTGQVINTETTANDSQRPCILVARFFTPDIIMNYRNILGIITEHGGATCHAAVLARTMGIPCVTGVDQATKLLSTGQLVHLEARGLMEPGTVEVME
jgi:phosphohistidine swiveling domain-containing protein